MQTQRRHLRCLNYGLLALALVCNSLWAGPLIGTPSTPALSEAGYGLIVDFEVGGGEGYYNRFLKRPSWPGGFSGVTIGVGADIGYMSPIVFLEDWYMLPLQDKDKLFGVVGYKGNAARDRLSQVRDIIIKWDIAEGVFRDVDVPRYWQLSRRAFPGFDLLHPDAQAVLVSLAFNRGTSMSGPGRVEMRELARLSPKKDYKGMAQQIRLMKRLWVGKGQDGLLRRREAEAKLMEKCQ